MSHDALLADQEVRRLLFVRRLYEDGRIGELGLRDEDGRPVPDPVACARGRRRARAARVLATAGRRSG